MPLVDQVLTASRHENNAIAHDRGARYTDAIKEYERAVQFLESACVVAQEHAHADYGALFQHKEEVNARIAYLRSLDNSNNSEKKVELLDPSAHIGVVQLSMRDGAVGNPAPPQAQSTNVDPSTNGSQSGAGSGLTGTQVLAAGAGLGALAGGIILGEILGIAALVGGAAAGAYAVTKKDATGDVSRSAAGLAHKAAVTAHSAGTSAVVTAKEVNEKHQITAKASALASNAKDQAKSVNQKYDISGRASRAADTAKLKAAEIDAKYQVKDKAKEIGDKAAAGLSKGLSKMSNFLKKS